jgi:hypothetical protein
MVGTVGADAGNGYVGSAPATRQRRQPARSLTADSPPGAGPDSLMWTFGALLSDLYTVNPHPHLDPHLDRRSFLHLGLGALSAGALVGCQTRSAARLPEPTWPASRGERSWKPPPASAAGTYLPRRQWTGDSPKNWLADPMGRVTRITLHHDGMSPFYGRSASDAVDRLDAIRRSHLGRGWADIGYHFAIDPLGNVWEGRPLNLQGAHVKDQNEQNIGVVVLGNFQEQSPTVAAVATVDRFLAQLMQTYRVPLRSVYTHQELGPTVCPGYHLQRHMEMARSARGALARA